MSSPFASVAVLGCGLIGGSFALASREVEGVEEVVVTDADPDVRARAGRTLEVVDDLADAVDHADLIVVAVPVESIAEVAIEALHLAKPGAIVTDVGSVKSKLVEDVESFLENTVDPRPRSSQFLGGHPMAGREQGGFQEADADLFRAATWLLTPTRAADPEVFNDVAAHLRALGAHVLAVEPDTHDRIVATTSHLPQVLASSLAAAADSAARASGEGLLATAAGGFRDVTRLAGSDPELWTGILAHNRPAVSQVLASFLEGLAAFHEAVDRGDWEAVRRRLEAGRTARQRLPVARRTGDLIDVVVAIPNRPGMLAEVTTTLGAAGVNIEDLEMRHASDASRGALVITVSGRETAERACELLEERDFTGHVEAR